MRLKLKRLACLALTLLLLLTGTLPALAAGGGNMGGDGGTVGQSVTNTYVSDGYSGARVTIVDGSGQRVPGTQTIDYIDGVVGGTSTWHFGKRSKVEYRGITNGSQLSVVRGGYSYRTIANLPDMVLMNGSNIDKIRFFFEEDYNSNTMAKNAGIRPTGVDEYPYRQTLIDGGYYILVEPLASVVVNGQGCTGTATELAFFSQTNALVKNYLTAYVHMQLPLALYLNYPQLGFAANPEAGTARVRSNSDIISYLGVGIVSFVDGEETMDGAGVENPEVVTPPSSYVYRTGTEVYTSVKVSNDTGRDINEPAAVTFTLSGAASGSYTMELTLPKDRSQLAYCRWTTPNAPGRVTVSVSVSDGLTLSAKSIPCTIETFGVSEPPDPTAHDTRDGWNYSSGDRGSNLSAEWGHWEWTDEAAPGRDDRIWYYRESGSTVYSAWKQDAVTTRNELQADLLRELQEKITTPARYSYGSWSSQISDNVPANNDTMEYEYLRSYPEYRARYRTVMNYDYAQTRYEQYWTATRGVYQWYWTDTTTTTTYTSHKGAYVDISDYYRWRYTGTEKNWLGITVYRYVKQQGAWRSYPASTTAVNYLAYRPADTVKPGQAKVLYTNIKSDYREAGTTGVVSSTVYAAGKRYYVGSGQKVFYLYTLKKVNYRPWGEWGGWSTRHISPGATCEVDTRTRVVYRQRSRELIAAGYTTYVYRTRTSSWRDTGSCWSASDGGGSGASAHRWVWVPEGASLGGTAVLRPDANNPTDYTDAYGVTYMKSGYGVNIEWTPTVYRRNTSETTLAQNSVALFPEFNWHTYGRLLRYAGGSYQFPQNRYSRFNSRVHFTPIWYPDGQEYNVLVSGFDCWTPAGQLYISRLTNGLMVDGSVYDDWSIVIWDR